MEQTLDIMVTNKNTGVTKTVTVTREQWFFLSDEMGLFKYNGYSWILETEEIFAITSLLELYGDNDVDFEEVNKWYPAAYQSRPYA